GLTLGGGLGVLTRAWGLACDQLTAARVVLADGTVVTCDANNEADLFWALRGGGGSFGAVTSLTFDTHPASDLALAFLIWPWADASAAVAGWQSWMRDAPDALWSTLHLEGGEGEKGVTTHAVYPARVAPDATAFPHRGARTVLQLIASWRAGASGDASLRWLADTTGIARKNIGTDAYANYVEPDLTNWAAAYYGANYPRLQRVKRRYDPDRLFDFPQAVVPA